MKSKNIFLLITTIIMTVFVVLDPIGGHLPAAYGASSAQGKSDVLFKIDCSQIDSSKQMACSSYIAATRDQVYPILRDMTGTDLSKCYKAVYYTIIPGDPRKDAGGWTQQNRITYNQRYSVDDKKYAYDIHELIHTISSCSGALDEGHVLHGPLTNTVFSHLGVHERFYFYYREDMENAVKSNFEDLKKPGRSRSDLQDTCKAILANQMTIVYFDLGEPAIKRLYQSAITPGPSVRSSKQLTSVWGQSANQVQALLDTLRQEYKYQFSVPACGY